jgi:uncharacterized protein
MGFEWNERKRKTNLEKHGIDFVRVPEIFEGDVLEFEDRRKNYGETRISAFGKIENKIYHVAYTWRGQNRRLISVRKAKDREKRIYYASYPRTGEEDEG